MFCSFLVFVLLLIWLLIIQNNISELKASNSELKKKIDGLSSSVRRLQHAENKNYNNDASLEENNFENKIIEQASEVKEAVPSDEYQEDISEETISEEDLIDEENYIPPSRDYSINENITNKNSSNELENVFLGNIFNIVGAIAIIIACGFFISVIAGNLSPLIKTVIGLVVGAGMITFGLNNKNDSLKRFSSILIGTGFAVLFICVYCATVLSHIFSISVCSILGLIIFILAYFVADKQKSAILPVIALAGGYLNVTITASEITLGMLFTYLIFLNIVSIIFVSKNKNKIAINFFNIIFTLLCIACYSMAYKPEVTSWGIIYPVLLWLAYTLFDVINRLKEEKYDTTGILNWVNYAALTIYSLMVFKFNLMHAGGFQLLLTIAFGILACIFMIKTTDRFKIYLRLMLFSIFATIMFTTQGAIRIGLLSLGAIILSYISSTYERQYLAKWAIGYLSAAVINIFIFNSNMYYLIDNGNYHPIFNMRALCFISPILASFASYLIMNKSEDKHCKNMASYLLFCGITLLYVFICFEINDFIQFQNNMISSATFTSFMTFSIVGSIYSLQMNKLGEVTGKFYYKAASITVYIITLLSLLTVGIKYMPIESFVPVVNIRFIAYIVAISTSLLYGKWNKQIVYNYIAVLLGFALITFETNNYIESISTANFNYLLSVLWIIYAGIITGLGIFKDTKYLKTSGIWITILAILKIILVDMANVDIMYKMITFVLLGAVLMIISYYYNKTKK